MIDLKFVSIRDLLPISQADFASGVSPKSVRIWGSGFRQAQEVRMNGIPAPEFFVISNTQILAQVPVGMENSTISKLDVLATSPSRDRNSVLHLELGRSFKKLQGLERLVQLFVKILLQTPGTDAFRPELGGGLLQVIGDSAVDGRTIPAEISSAVARTKAQIYTLQNAVPRIPPDERLLDATLSAAGFDLNTTSAAAEVQLTAVSGQQAVANLTF